jgi:hypothetical protein
MTHAGKSETRNTKLESKSIVSVFLVASCLLMLVVLSGGCQPQVEALKACPAKPTLDAAVAGLNERATKLQPLKASGRCAIQFYDEDGRKRSESFPVVIRTALPRKLYFQGDLVVPKSVILGTSSRDFWLWVKLKEVSTFWYGPLGGCAPVSSFGLLMTPGTVMEALGYIDMPAEAFVNCTLSQSPPFDVLSMHAPNGEVARKVYLYSCDSTPRKIEYFAPGGKLIMTATLSYYAPVAADFSVPTLLEMTVYREKGKSEKLSIRLNKDTLEVFKPTNAQTTQLFNRPVPRGVEHIYELNDGCEFIEVERGQ